MAAWAGYRLVTVPSSLAWPSPCAVRPKEAALQRKDAVLWSTYCAPHDQGGPQQCDADPLWMDVNLAHRNDWNQEAGTREGSQRWGEAGPGGSHGTVGWWGVWRMHERKTWLGEPGHHWSSLPCARFCTCSHRPNCTVSTRALVTLLTLRGRCSTGLRQVVPSSGVLCLHHTVSIQSLLLLH